MHIGLLLSTYGVFPLLLAVYAGRLADRYGARIPIISGMAVCTLGVALPWFMPILPLLFVAAAVTGFGFILGQVALQSMPIMNLAEEIGRYLPGRSESSSSSSVGGAAAAVAVGGLLGGLFGGGASKDDTEA